MLEKTPLYAVLIPNYSLKTDEFPAFGASPKCYILGKPFLGPWTGRDLSVTCDPRTGHDPSVTPFASSVTSPSLCPLQLMTNMCLLDSWWLPSLIINPRKAGTGLHISTMSSEIAAQKSSFNGGLTAAHRGLEGTFRPTCHRHAWR